MIVPTQQTSEQTELARQGTQLLELLAGYLGTWTIELGLRAGLIRSLAEHPEGATSGELASGLALDAEYVDVWCHAAAASGLLDLTADGRYILAPHLATLLLDADAPEYLGGLVRACAALRETFVDLRRFVRSGQRKARSRLSTESIAAVNDMSVPFYQRLADEVIPTLPSVAQALREGGHVLDLGCGTCAGLSRVAQVFPRATFTAVDGDWYSIEQARLTVRQHGLADRFEVIHADVESLSPTSQHDLAIINLALHGELDVSQVIEVARNALRPGGTALVSALPMLDNAQACRDLGTQIIHGLQYFEAHLGGRALPICRIVARLERAGFRDVATIEATSLQAVIVGSR